LWQHALTNVEKEWKMLNDRCWQNVSAGEEAEQPYRSNAHPITHTTLIAVAIIVNAQLN
jgi:hypothetical protein